MTAVKVCGLTRERDVRLAVECGAWACGFVLTDSPRRVTAQQAGPLARAARSTARSAAGSAVLTVGVVTTESPAWIAAALAVAGLAAVQLSAGADGPTVAAVRAAAMSSGLRPLLIAAADTPDAGDADLVLLDARAPGVYGGSGATLDWGALAAARNAPGPVSSAAVPPAAVSPVEKLSPAVARPVADRLVLAGGLAPGNVGAAIAALRPWSVDVSSGLEAPGAPGRKDEGLLRAFFAAVRAADAQPALSAVTGPTTTPEVDR